MNSFIRHTIILKTMQFIINREREREGKGKGKGR
jgi:hypothetical protein